MTVANTIGGAGSLALPANSAAIHQVVRNRMKDNSRSPSIPRLRIVVRARTELRARADQLASADSSQHAIEDSGVSFLVGDRPVRNAVAVAVAIGLQGGLIWRAGERGDGVPLGIGVRQDLLGLRAHAQELGHHFAMRMGPVLVEDI